jgi:nitronate monooxygenase
MNTVPSWAMTRVAERLGVRYPIVQGPFGGGLSSVGLTAAVSDAGGLGSFGANYLEPTAITELVDELRSLTSRPFNVNLWVPLPGEADARLTADELPRHVARIQPYLDALGVPAPTAPPAAGPNYEQQVEALLHAAPPVISFVFGVPSADVLAEARARGITTIGTATTVDEAVALDAAGIDLIVASGSDAGGHRGAFLRPVEESLVGTFSLVPQIVDAVAAPVIAAGGIADARQVKAAFVLGAEGVQIGTAFLVTSESSASRAHKDALTGNDARTTVLTAAFTGRHARAVPNRVTRELARATDELPPYPLQGALMAPIRRAAAAQHNGDYLNLWAGQSAALARARGAVDYLEDLVGALPAE